MAPHRKVVKAKGIKKALPKRPPRPTTGYNLFVQDYVRKNGHNRDTFRQASIAWQRLPVAEREVYNRRNQAEKNRREGAVKKWTKTNKATKRPPSAYCLFVRDLWKTEAEVMGQMDFREAARTASARWLNLTAAQKAKYQQDHQDLMTRYRQEAEKVENGGALDENWMLMGADPAEEEDGDDDNEGGDDNEDGEEMEEDVENAEEGDDDGFDEDGDEDGEE